VVLTKAAIGFLALAASALAPSTILAWGSGAAFVLVIKNPT